MKKYSVLLISFSIIILSSCSDSYNSTNSTQNKLISPKITIKKSKLLSMINKENVCELIITGKQIQQLFNSKFDINISGSEYEGAAYCDYSWDQVDKAERQQKYTSYLVINPAT